MTVIPDFFRAHLPELASGVVVSGMLGVMALFKRRSIAKAAKWPTVRARIENVFVDVDNQRTGHTHAVLAYGYSINGSHYSGEIHLTAGDQSLESLEKEMIGLEISIHYNPQNPPASMFTNRKVRGWVVL